MRDKKADKKEVEKAFIELYDSSEKLYKWNTEFGGRGDQLKYDMSSTLMQRLNLRHTIMKYGCLRTRLT